MITYFRLGGQHRLKEILVSKRGGGLSSYIDSGLEKL